jgi:flavin-binding protein dodecin
VKPQVSAARAVMSVYRVTEIIGTSSIHLDESGAITYRTKLQLSFKYEPGH